MRRTAKTFTIEVKKRGGRREQATPAFGTVGSELSDLAGRDLRFRDAENLFRSASGDNEPALATPVSLSSPDVDATAEPAALRRILPDLVAEAALSEQTVPQAEPRRRGRPRKNPDALASASPAKRGRPRKIVVTEHPLAFLDRWHVEDPESAPVVSLAVVDLPAASSRRRAARDVSHLPRAERWKRRLPPVCW